MDTEKIKDYILSHIGGILKPPVGCLEHPFVVPGTGYTTELWGWDAYWEALAIVRIFEALGTCRAQKATGISRQTAIDHICGSVLDFLDAQEADGYIPIMVSGGGLFEGYFKSEHKKGTPLNQHLPFLCQLALLAQRFSDRKFDAEKLEKYMRYFETRQYDENSRLFFWQDDVMIGIDNNPTVFYRPPKSGADIFLNSFMYAEYAALIDILRARGKNADEFQAKAEKLKTAINTEMWDERDGIYYSQDIGFFKTNRTVKGVALHSGLDPHWKTMPLKIRFWACFLPMYVGLCNAEQADRLCLHLTENDDFFAEYGIRTLAKNEKMYSLAKSVGNPSNWLGAVWGIADYCVYKGLMRYGKTDEAEKLKDATVKLLNKNLDKYGDFFESYHPDTGEPFMHPGFLSHNLPIVDMIL